MSAAYKAGDEVFDIEGNAYSYVGRCNGGHAVQAIHEDEDGEPYFAAPIALTQVFITPPRQKLADDLSGILAEIKAKRDELSDLRAEINATQNEKRAVLAKAKSDPQLADLYLWLEGKATHLVLLDTYSVTIGPIKEMLEKREERETTIRLLSLHYDPKALHYRVQRSAYVDGSGSYTICQLAESEEHAKALARSYIAEKLRDPNSGNTWTRIAMDYSIPVTQERANRATREANENAARQLASARQMRTHAEQQLAAAEAAVAKATGASA